MFHGQTIIGPGFHKAETIDRKNKKTTTLFYAETDFWNNNY